MAQHRVLKCGKQVQNRAQVRGDPLLWKRTKIRISQLVRRDPLSGIQTSSTFTCSGHMSTRYPPPLSHTWKGLLQIKSLEWVANQEWNGRSRQKFVDLENAYVFYFERSNSSGKELPGESTFHQESRDTNDKAIVRSITKTDQRSL